MKYAVHIQKPVKTLKMVAKQLEECLYFNNCSGCWLNGDNLCQMKLMSAGLWYLRQKIEEEEDARKAKKKAGADAAGFMQSRKKSLH